MNFSNFFSSLNSCSFSFHILQVLAIAIAHSLNSKYIDIILFSKVLLLS